MSEASQPYSNRVREFVRARGDAPWRTRFAPAPTGAMHLGHLVNAIFVWGLARAFGGRVLLRIEDHDRIRCRPEYESALLDDLEWLGLVPDEPAINDFRASITTYTTTFRQSNNGAAYDRALSQLIAADRIFACSCTRRDIAKLVPDRFGEEMPYPGTCRNLHRAVAPESPLRVRLDETVEQFDDLRLGAQTQQPSTQCGDMLLRDRHSQWTYQFAVTVDDMNQDIDVVIRGEDLLSSTGRQLQLARMLGRTTPPVFLHHPLLLRDDGLKLSKSNHDTGLAELRSAGHTAEQLFGMAAHRAGLIDNARPIAAKNLGELFSENLRHR